jgi:hypothetical protein
MGAGHIKEAGMRKYKRSLVWLAAVVVLIAIGTAAAWQCRYHQQQELMLNAAQIQIVVERYAVDNGGSLPTDIGQVISKGYVKDWPDNPFGQGSMQPIAPDAKAAAGSFVYVALGPVIAQTNGRPLSPAEVEASQGIPTEVDGYLLIFYGPGHYRYPVPKSIGSLYFDSVRYSVDWDRVALVLFPGEK